MKTVAIRPPANIHMVLQWEDDEPKGTSAEATRGNLAIFLGDSEVPLWGTAPDGFSWTWIELLEYLAENWVPLFELDSRDPVGLGVFPETLLDTCRGRWVKNPQRKEVEERRVLAYLEEHNLIYALHGAYPSGLWVTMFKAFNELRIACGSQVAYLPIRDGVLVFRDLGNAIADRLKDYTDLRSTMVLTKWEKVKKVSTWPWL